MGRRGVVAMSGGWERVAYAGGSSDECVGLVVGRWRKGSSDLDCFFTILEISTLPSLPRQECSENDNKLFSLQPSCPNYVSSNLNMVIFQLS